tara:strand:- start:4098 stop:4355 length:258 start_codon:yes stop_codon:yes gene_type:complete
MACAQDWDDVRDCDCLPARKAVVIVMQLFLSTVLAFNLVATGFIGCQSPADPIATTIAIRVFGEADGTPRPGVVVDLPNRVRGAN